MASVPSDASKQTQTDGSDGTKALSSTSKVISNSVQNASSNRQVTPHCHSFEFANDLHTVSQLITIWVTVHKACIQRTTTTMTIAVVQLGRYYILLFHFATRDILIAPEARGFPRIFGAIMALHCPFHCKFSQSLYYILSEIDAIFFNSRIFCQVASEEAGKLTNSRQNLTSTASAGSAQLSRGSVIAVNPTENATSSQQRQTRLGDPRRHVAGPVPRPAAVHNRTVPSKRNMFVGSTSRASAQMPARQRVGWGRVSYAPRRRSEPTIHTIYEEKAPRRPVSRDHIASTVIANRTSSSRRSATSTKKLPSGCIQMGPDFIPPHVRTALSRRSDNLIVGSPPGQRLERMRLAMKYHPEYRASRYP